MTHGSIQPGVSGPIVVAAKSTSNSGVLPRTIHRFACAPGSCARMRDFPHLRPAQLEHPKAKSTITRPATPIRPNVLLPVASRIKDPRMLHIMPTHDQLAQRPSNSRFIWIILRPRPFIIRRSSSTVGFGGLALQAGVGNEMRIDRSRINSGSYPIDADQPHPTLPPQPLLRLPLHTTPKGM